MSKKWRDGHIAMIVCMMTAILAAAIFTANAMEYPAVVAWVIAATFLVAITRSSRWEERQEISRWKRATRAAEEKRAQEETLQRALEIRRGKRRPHQGRRVAHAARHDSVISLKCRLFYKRHFPCMV